MWTRLVVLSATFVGLCGFGASQPSVAAQEPEPKDVLSGDIELAKKVYISGLRRAREGLIEEFNKRIKRVESDKKLDVARAVALVKQLQTECEMFKSQAATPTSLYMKDGAKAYEQAVSTSKKTWVTEMRRIADQYRSKGSIDKAAAVLDQIGPFAEAGLREVMGADPMTVDAGGMWIELFNKRDLTGWQSTDKRHVGWTVERGLLVSKSGQKYDLMTTGNKYRDYQLRMEIWGQHELDSGVFLRGSSSALAEAGLYEVQISTKREERCNTGTIFLIPPRKLGEGLGVGAQVLSPPHKPAEWFSLDIIVRGNSITTIVNGTKTGTYSDERRLFQEGVIGLQHPGDQQIQFRQILIQELKGTGR